MKKSIAGALALALAGSTLVATPAQASTRSEALVCTVNDRTSTYRVDWYPEYGQYVESIAYGDRDGANVRAKFDDGVMALTSTSIYNDPVYYTGQSVYRYRNDLFVQVANDSESALRDGQSALVARQVEECLANVLPGREPLSYTVDRPANLPDAPPLVPKLFPPSEPNRPGDSEEPAQPGDAEEPMTAEEMSTAMSSVEFGVGLAVIAAIIGVLMSIDIIPGTLPFLG